MFRRTVVLAVAIGICTVSLGACTTTASQINTKPGSGTANTVATGQSGKSQPTSSTVASDPLAVTDQGFSQLAPDSIGNSYVTEAAILKWSSTNKIATEVQVTFTLTNAAGTVVNSDNETVGAILPGQTVAVTNNAQASGATALKVQAIAGSTQAAPSGPIATITPSGVTTTDPDGFGLQTNGTVTSTATKELQNVQAVAVYTNAGGQIIGGDFTFVSFIPASGSTSFQISGTNEIPGYSATQVYFSISNLTLNSLG